VCVYACVCVCVRERERERERKRILNKNCNGMKSDLNCASIRRQKISFQTKNLIFEKNELNSKKNFVSSSTAMLSNILTFATFYKTYLKVLNASRIPQI